MLNIKFKFARSFKYPEEACYISNNKGTTNINVRPSREYSRIVTHLSAKITAQVG